MSTLQEQVKQFLRQEWFKQREEERRRKEAVAAQTVACLQSVRIPCGIRGQRVPYGVVCEQWRDTLALCQKLNLPVNLLFPDVLHFRDVNEAHVAELARRLQTELQLRWQVLNACNQMLPRHESGQAWLSTYLGTTRWLPLTEQLLDKWEESLTHGEGGGQDAEAHGTVERMFITFAALLPTDKWPHVYAWSLVFLAHLVDSGALPATAAPPAPAPPHLAQQLLEWLLQYYDPDWQCLEEVALRNLSTAWRRRCTSTADVPLPPTTCPTYEAFEAAVAARSPHSLQPPPAQRPAATGSNLLRMTRRSALHSPMFFDPDKLTFI